MYRKIIVIFLFIATALLSVNAMEVQAQQAEFRYQRESGDLGDGSYAASVIQGETITQTFVLKNISSINAINYKLALRNDNDEVISSGFTIYSGRTGDVKINYTVPRYASLGRQKIYISILDRSGNDLEPVGGGLYLWLDVQECPKPTADFSFRTSSSNPLKVSFSDESSARRDTPLTSWCWLFGDGSRTDCGSSNISHTYSTSGTYTVKLIVTNSCGQRDTETKSVSVKKSELIGLTIKGDTEVDEGSSSYYTVEARYDDSTTKNITSSCNLRLGSTSYATISSRNGRLTAKSVTRNREVRIYAEYTDGGVSRDHDMRVTIVNKAKLIGLTIKGDTEVDEGASSYYTVEARYDDSTTKNITSSCNLRLGSTSYATISSRNGRLTAKSVTRNKEVRIYAEYTDGGVSRDHDMRVTIVNKAKLIGLTIKGDTEVDEGSSSYYTVDARYDDSTTKNITSSCNLRLGSTSYATISSRNGRLTAKSVTRNKEVRIYAEYTDGGVSRDHDMRVTIVNIPPKLTRLEIYGQDSVEEGKVASYTVKATYDDGTSKTVTSDCNWNVAPSSYSSINSGTLTARSVNANQQITVKASYTDNGITKSAEKTVSIENVPAKLTRLEIYGQGYAEEGKTASYTGKATYDDGSDRMVTSDCNWSVAPSSYAGISMGGMLTAKPVTSNQQVIVKASYTDNGVTKIAEKTVSIKDVLAELIGLEIRGQGSVQEGESTPYEAIAKWSDGSDSDVTNQAKWYAEPSAYASIDNSSGNLTALSIEGDDKQITVKAVYLDREAEKSVKIKDRDVSSPTVSLPADFEVTSGIKVEIPINISGVTDAGIGGYSLRLDYDENVLSNPKAILTGTLSEGNPDIVEATNPSDGIGKFAMGIGFGFSPNQDGVLAKVQFDVSSDFSGTTKITFASKNEKTNLSTAGFDKIDSTFTDGSLKASSAVTVGAPRNLTATAVNSDGETVLNWDAPADTTPDGYNIYRDDVLVETVTGDQLTHTDSGLEAGTEYCYHVTALIGDQESNPSNEVCPSSEATSDDHFTKVWENNPHNRMQLWVISAFINDESLTAGDEIGVFDGEKCVGFGKVTAEITMENPLNIITSQAYEDGNGFKGGNEISFRIWDASEEKEIADADISASFFDAFTGDPMEPPEFESSADFGVSLEVTVESDPVISQTIILRKGWNFISSYVVPSDPDMLEVFRPLTDNDVFKQMIDEDEASLMFSPFMDAWTYTGTDDFNNEDGYKVWVTEDTELTIEGLLVELPIDIPLYDGPNIMGYPVSSPQPSGPVFQPLMDDDSLRKVYDEDDGTIIQFFGAWRDNIEELTPGEGYVVQVKRDTSVRIDRSGPSARSAARKFSRKKRRDDRFPVHFSTAWEGNPHNRMNLWVIGIDDYGVEDGDEIGIFDGEKCVGIGVVDGEVSPQKILTITTSQDYGRGDGFTEGNEASFRFWDSGTDTEIMDAKLLFLELSDGSEIIPPVFEKYGDYGVILRMDYTMNEFPVSVPKDMSSVIDVLSIDSDPDENALTITDVSEAVNGVTVVNTTDNTIIYTPDDGYIGADIFSYTVNNGTESAHATVKVVVSESDDVTEDDDEDGIPDEWEMEHFGDLSHDNTSDEDGDGLSDAEEYDNGTDPTNIDTDEDGISDAWEVDYGFDPLDDTDASKDSDGDGHTNLHEYNGGSDPADPESYPVVGAFTVRDGKVKIDYLYDGGMYESQLGIFSLSAMDKYTLNSPEFIEEAARRALSESEEGCIVVSDRTQGARFSGQLGSGSEPDRNRGDYKGVKTCTMVPGDTFATILVPNSTMQTLYDNPGTSNSHIRPIFSLASANPEHQMYFGQIAKIRDGDEEFRNAIAYEDMLLSANSDRDYNDLIVHFTGVTVYAPTLDNPELGLAEDWRLEGLGSEVVEHIEVSPPDPDTKWITITLKSPADLLVYDPQGRVIGKEGGYIPGASFETDENGHQIVSLPALDEGEYRIVLRAIGDGGLCHLEIKGFQGGTELVSQEEPFVIGPHEVFKTEVSASSFTEGGTIRFEVPEVRIGCDFNGDGVRDDIDIEKISSLWNTCEGDEGYDAFYDFDDDGCITILDIMYVVNGC